MFMLAYNGLAQTHAVYDDANTALDALNKLKELRSEEEYGKLGIIDMSVPLSCIPATEFVAKYGEAKPKTLNASGFFTKTTDSQEVNDAGYHERFMRFESSVMSFDIISRAKSCRDGEAFISFVFDRTSNGTTFSASYPMKIKKGKRVGDIVVNLASDGYISPADFDARLKEYAKISEAVKRVQSEFIDVINNADNLAATGVMPSFEA